MRWARRKVIEWRWDLGRTLDYLQSRADIDARNIGYLGTSFGGSYVTPLIAVETGASRPPCSYRAATRRSRFPRSSMPRTYVPRIRMPALMINGR